MAYSADKEPDQLTELTSLDSGDVFVVGDISDATEAAKYITKANLITDLADETQTLTNKTFDADGTGNSITNIENADIKAAAGIAVNKLAALTADELVISDGSGFLTTSTGVSATEASYLNGVTSAIQTQIDTKAPTASPTFTGTVTLPTGLTGVIRADTGVVSVDSDVTDIVTAATDSAAGKVELATAAETTTGTDATRAVSPDGLAGSDFGIRYVQAVCFDFTTDTATGDGKFYFHVPAAMDGMNLVEVHAEVITAGTTGTTDIQIHNVDNALDMLSTKLTIDSGETGSDTAAAAAVINTSNDHVNENDVVRIDVDAVSTTAAKGLIVTLGFQLP